MIDTNRPDRYALDVAAGPPGCRATLFALAIRANTHCGCVIAGEWVATAVGEHPGSIRRHIHTLVDLGIVECRHLTGGPLLVRFPTSNFIHNPAHQCAGCREWRRAAVRETPRSTARYPAQQCAVKQSENRCENTDDSQHWSERSIDEVRKIWTSARDTAREATREAMG